MKHIVGYSNFQSIEESLLSSIDVERIVDKDLTDHVIVQGEEILIPQYKEENYLYDVEDEDIDQEDFSSWVEEDLKFKMNELLQFYRSEIVKNGKVVVWRKMTVSEDWISRLPKEGKHLGIYWTWDPDAADTHWGDYSKKSVVLIEAEAPENGVDWEKTLITNVEPLMGDDEKEITLNKGVPLKILSIEVDGNQVDISSLRDKTFFS